MSIMYRRVISTFLICLAVSPTALTCTPLRDSGRYSDEYFSLSAIGSSSVVFRGRSFKVSPSGTDQIVIWSVFEKFYGGYKNEVASISTTEASMCGFTLEQGREYIVYLQKSSDSIKRIVRVIEVDSVSEQELDFLKKIKSGEIDPENESVFKYQKRFEAPPRSPSS